jgi:hypothetical protein
LVGFNGGSIVGQDVHNIFGPSVFVIDGGSITPLPTALPLFATGIGGSGLFGWRRKRKAQA